MGSNKINIDQLAAEVMKDLEIYRDATLDVVDYAVKKTAKEAVEEIRDNIDSAGIGGTEYRKSWAQKKSRNSRGRWSSGRIVYSKLPGLPHLLEDGHAKVNGGRVEGRPHIALVAKHAQENVEFYIRAGIAQDKQGR